MADTYTDRSGLILMDEGTHTNEWGDLANLNFARIDSLVRGYKKITLSGAETLDSNDITTTGSIAEEESFFQFIEFAGTAGTVTVPAENIMWIVRNSTGSNFTFQPSGGTGVTLTNGKTHIIVYGANGTTFVDVTDELAGLLTPSSADTLTNKIIDGDDNTLQDIGTASLKTKTGADAAVVTGTAGTSGDLAQWDANGDVVDGPTPPSGAIVGTTDSQVLTNKTIDGDDNTLQDIGTASLKTKTGADAAVVTGTAGTSGDLVLWNVDGDVVDGPTPPSGAIVGTTDTQTLSAKTLTSPVLNTQVTGDAVKDEDNMVSDSALHLCTQQSIKKYVDDNAGSTIGAHTMWIPASDMVSRTTNGAASGSIELSTNKVMLKTLDFDPTVEEFAQFVYKMPKKWDEGTITFRAITSHTTGATAYGSVFYLEGSCISSGNSIDRGYDNGTGANSIYPSMVTPDYLYFGGLSGTVTLGWTPAAEDYIQFQINRNVDHASDTLDVDCRLHGIVIYYTTEADTDA